MLSTPPIRFFEAPNHHRVAYTAHGRGSPLVCAAWWVSNLEHDWQDEGFRRFFGALGEHHTVVRYDRVGAGQSQRERTGVTLAEETRTLAALIDHLGLSECSLFGLSCGGPPALAYAATHPSRVSRLVLFNSFLSGRHVGDRATRDALVALVRAQWGIGAKVIADLFAPGLSKEETAILGRAQRAAADGEMAARLLALTFDVDVHDLAAAVKAPTRVVHRKGDHTIRLAAGQALAAAVPNAELVLLDGKAHVPWLGDIDVAVEAVLSFFAGEPPHSAPRPPEDEGSVWRREGELWLLRFAGQTVRLKSSLGLEDLSVLLLRKGQQVHATELYGGEAGASAYDVLDEPAIAAYRARLGELDEELDEAVSRCLTERAEQLRAERQTIASELAAGVGLGGRRRGLNDPAERARKAVSARIRAVFDRLDQLHPKLARHLRAHVRTGRYCSYEPGDSSAFRVE